jgi:riboflavin synthase
MFTGLVEARGRVTGARAVGAELDLEVALGPLAERARIGDSVALSGVCCTITGLSGGIAGFHLSEETLRRSWLGAVAVGQELNLEAALRVGDPLGGHLVQGHVDGLGLVTGAVDAAAGGELRVRLPAALARYCVEKGSIALDGVSLTIARLERDTVAVAVIPHTARVTTIGCWREGQRINVEVDVLAKYVERLLAGRLEGTGR